jgi:hypothetical protein
MEGGESRERENSRPLTFLSEINQRSLLKVYLFQTESFIRQRERY